MLEVGHGLRAIQGGGDAWQGLCPPASVFASKLFERSPPSLRPWA